MDINEPWCIGYDLQERWGISHDNLVQRLLNGDLKAYPDIISEPYSKEDIEDYVRNCQENPWMYEHGVWGFSFRVDNVLEFEKLHNSNVGHDKDENELKVAMPEEMIEQNLDDFPADVIDLINEARPEIELIYKAVKEGEGFNNLGEKYDDLRMKDALNYFEEYEGNFRIIKKEDLQNTEIFKTSMEQHARMVKGKLLQSIIKTRRLGDYPYDKLFKEYQKNK